MAKYRVTHPKAYDAKNKMVPVGTIFEADEVPGFLVGKVAAVSDEEIAAIAGDPDAAKKAAEAAKK